MKARQSIKNASSVDAAMRFEELEGRIERMEADADMIYSGYLQSRVRTNSQKWNMNPT